MRRIVLPAVLSAAMLMVIHTITMTAPTTTSGLRLRNRTTARRLVLDGAALSRFRWPDEDEMQN